MLPWLQMDALIMSHQQYLSLDVIVKTWHTSACTAFQPIPHN